MRCAIQSQIGLWLIEFEGELGFSEFKEHAVKFPSVEKAQEFAANNGISSSWKIVPLEGSAEEEK